MKITIECKHNCITVKTKAEAETLYDFDLKPWITSMELSDFIDKVFDYFTDILDENLPYKEIEQVCTKVYKNLK